MKDDVATDGDEDFEIDKSSGVLSFKESPNYEGATGGGASGTSNTYSVTVVATDANGLMTEKAVRVDVTNVDEDGSVTLDKVAPHPAVLLTATLTDPDGVVSGSDEWQWSWSRSKSGSYPDIEDAEAKTYTPTDGDEGYYLRATVTYKDAEGDGKSAVATSAHKVQVINEPNAGPVFPDQNAEMIGLQNTATTRIVGENADAGANVGAPVVAEDGDSDILTYTLGGDDASSFKIDAATGQITVGAKTKVNFEEEGREPTYMVTVTATDPAAKVGQAAEITVTINVSDDANEPPAITGAVTDSFDEEQADDALIVVTFNAVDPDPDNLNNMTITWSLGGPDAGDFTIEEGALTFRASPNYEMPADADGDNVYEVTVAATDADSNRGEKSVKVKVANVNELGTVTLSAVQPRVGVPLTASLTDLDGGVSGLKWQWNDIDGATSDTYTPTSEDVGDTLTATATYIDAHIDAQGLGKMAVGEAANVVAADTRNKAPEFADQDEDTDGTQNTEAERTIAENADVDTALNGGEVTATDPNEGDQLTYTLGGPDASSFDIGSAEDTEGQITVGAGTKLDFETKPTYMVTVIATDSFGESASIDVTITVTDVNEGPEISLGGLGISGKSSAEYPEHGTDPIDTYMASGPESDMAVWSLGGDDAGDFSISRGGELTFNTSPDYENPVDKDMDNVYMVTVMANDGTYDAMRMVTVTVTKVDEQVVVGDSLLARYDADKDGWIQLEEARVAVGDYFGPPKGVKLSLADTRKVVGLYFEYRNRQ